MAKAIFFTEAATPEAMRDEIVADLRDSAERARRSAVATRGSRDKAKLMAEAAALERMADHWAEVLIGHPRAAA